MWLAVFTAIVPVLAIPVNLIKIIVVAAAIVMAGIAYSLNHKSGQSSASKKKPRTTRPETPQKKQTAPVASRESNADEDAEDVPKELTEDDIKKQFFRTGNTKRDESSSSDAKEGQKSQKDDTPINVTDPNSDRFIAVNTYKNRAKHLRK